MGMKGISPLIASILLIAFTLSVAVVIGSWLTSISTQQTGIVGGSINETVTCAQGVLNIVSIINSTTITIQNQGQIDLSGDFTLSCGPNITTTSSVSLDKGKMVAISLNNTIGCQTPGNKIRVSSHTCAQVYMECTYGTNCP